MQKECLQYWGRGLYSLGQMVSTEDRVLWLPPERFVPFTPQEVMLLQPVAENPISTSNNCLCCPIFVLLIIFRLPPDNS